MADLPRPLKTRGVPLARTRIPVGGTFLEIRHLRDTDALLDTLSREEIQDEKLPYYGELWPSSIALARQVWRLGDLTGRRILDLGCGVGLAGIAAARRGGKVTFMDYFPEALELARENAQSNGCEGHHFLHHDWRKPLGGEPFDLILGADLLYEARNHEPVLDFLRQQCARGGEILIADPDRPNARPFFEAAGKEFLQTRDEIPVKHRDLDLTILIYRMQRQENSA